MAPGWKGRDWGWLGHPWRLCGLNFHFLENAAGLRAGPGRERCARAAAPCPPGGAPRGGPPSGSGRIQEGPGWSPRPARFQPRSSACSGEAPPSSRHRHRPCSSRPQRDLPGAPAGLQPRRDRSRCRSGGSGLGPNACPRAASPARGDPGTDPCPNPALVLRSRTPSSHRQDPDPNPRARAPPQLELCTAPGAAPGPGSAQRSELQSRLTPAGASTAPSGAGAGPAQMRGAPAVRGWAEEI